MKYLLTVLTNGRSDYLERSLAAFDEFVTPKPAERFIHSDGNKPLPSHIHTDGWTISRADFPLGFTLATKACLDYAAQSEYDWFFHLEDDFVILRPTDLRDMARVISLTPGLKQIALMRAAWGQEIEYGSYVMQHASQYERMRTLPTSEWMRTTRNWTTNPALSPTSFPREHPYPEVQHSEGIYGFQIREREPDAFFGLWGWGEPWCAHIGIDRAQGSHGY